MSITSGFFDSVNGDRLYDADQMSNYFDGLVSNGVYESIGDRFLVSSANSGMAVTVGTGRAIINSRWVKNDATETLTLDPSDVQLMRIDAIVLRLDTDARSITLTIKKGTAVSSNPTMPEITRTATVYELYLASVLIGKGATQPTSITDLRPSSYCGWVTGVVQQVDTSDLFNQWQTAYAAMFASFEQYMLDERRNFDAWFADLTQELTVDTEFTKIENYVQFPAGITIEAGLIVPVGIEDYDMENDALMVYLDGLFLSDVIDYNKRTYQGAPAIQYHGKPVKTTQYSKMQFVVFKNKIGKHSSTSGVASTTAIGNMIYTIGIAEQGGEV